ncbi:MAG: LamG domain-containing protein [Verrucomicrobiales bacterium]
MTEEQNLQAVFVDGMGTGQPKKPLPGNGWNFPAVFVACMGVALFSQGEVRGGTPAYSSVVLADGPVAYWDFDDAAVIDSSGNGHDGTGEGNIEFGVESFSENLLTAINLNGIDAFVKVPALGNFAQSTIEAWVMVDAINWRSLKDAGYLTSIFSTSAFGGGSHHLNIHLSLNIEQAIAAGGPNNIVSPNNTIRIGSWQHIVSTYDSTAGGAGRIYVNGVQVQADAHGAAPKAVLGSAQIGSWGGRRLLDGRIDEVAVYDSVLSPSRIMAHFKAATAIPLKRVEIASRPAIGVVGSGIEGSITVNAGDEFAGKLAFEQGIIRVSGVGGKPLSPGNAGQGASQAFPGKDVKIVHFTKVEAETVAVAEKLPPLRDRRIWLKAGSLVVGKLMDVDSKSVTLETGGGLTMLPRAAVAVIDMRGGTVEGEMLRGTPPGYLLQNSNFVEAKLEGITKEGKFATWSPIFGRREVALSKVRAVKLAAIKNAPSKGFVITTFSGSLILVDSIISKGARLIVRDSSRYFLNLHASEVLEIRRLGD